MLPVDYSAPYTPPPPPQDSWTYGVVTRADTDRGVGRLAEFKRVIEEYDKYTRSWITKEKEAEVIEPPRVDPDEIPELERFCFVHRKQISPQGTDLPPVVTEYLQIKSWYLRKAGSEVVGSQTGISWYAAFLQIVPNQILGYYPEFRAYLRDIQERETKSEEDEVTIAHLELFLNFLALEYKFTLVELEDLARTREISSAYFWALYKPNKLYVTNSVTTGAPIVVRLTSGYNSQTCAPSLSAESFEVDDAGYFWSSVSIPIPVVYGRVATTSLSLYPLEHHPDVEGFKQTLISRGRKWSDHNAILHRYYDGTAFIEDKNREIMLRDRVMVDRESYHGRRSLTPSDTWVAPPNTPPPPPPPPPVNSTYDEDPLEPTDENLLLAPAHLYGFSLSDKRWYIFQVENLHPITWDPTAFHQLSMDMERKALLQSLVEFHRADSSFRDIVQSKGRGLVLNLFGPPGTGKTLTAEAISEHVHKPLYRIAAGELGTYSSAVSQNLTKIFSLCGNWDAIILLDEADIFLESRANNEIDRNAMVSVFLKELEYFDGILFLTTNRIETFDPAFQSRIHVSLRYEPLSFNSRREIWISLLKRSGYDHEKHPLTDKELAVLAGSVKNGREIRNIVRTAEAVAASRKETLGYRHLLQVKDVSNAFELSRSVKTPPAQVATQTKRTLQERLVEDYLSELLAFAGFMTLLIAMCGMIVVIKDTSPTTE